MAVGTLGFMISAAVYYSTKGYIIESNVEKSPLFAEYVYLLLPFIFITIFHFIIDTYNRLLFNASFGLFVKELFLRLINLVTIGLYWLKWIDFNQFILIYTISYGIPVVLICLLLIYKKQFSLKPSFAIFTRKFAKEIFSVAMFGLISGFSGIAVLQIDRYLVNHYCDLSATGVYSTVYFFGAVILLPGRSLVRISSTLIAEAIRNNEWDKVADIYSKSTTTLTITGVALFLLVWGNINNIMELLPPAYEIGRYSILFISLAHLVQMIAGVSSEIIQSSKYYRHFTLLMVLLITSIIIFNVIFIPIIGITGAALASAVSFSLYLLVRYWFIYVKFGLQPFKIKHFAIIFIGAASLGISTLLPHTGGVIVDTAIRSTILLSLFLVSLYFSGFSPELHTATNAVFRRIEEIKKKNRK